MLNVSMGLLLVLAVVAFGARAWTRRGGARRPGRGRTPVRERQLGRAERAPDRPAAGGRRVPIDVPVAQSRAIALANRRSIRWKDNA